MRRAVVTGLGFVTSIGNGRAEVLESLRTRRSGIELFAELERDNFPKTLAGAIKGFRFPDENVDGWEMPAECALDRGHLRSMAPHGLYAVKALREAIAESGLTSELVSHPRTGIMCASAGSSWLTRFYQKQSLDRPVQRWAPMGMVASIAGTLNFNLVAAFAIKGASAGFSSACSSSAHAIGTALDLIRLDRQDIIFAVGAEDCDFDTIAPFAAFRALSRQTDPALSPCAFDVKRDGFVATGGATVLVIEELEHARRRNAPIYAEVAGWGQSSDGYNVMAPEPNGEGLARAMQLAADDAGIAASEIDYINAHATSTPAGDRAELRALKRVFGENGRPFVSSTKSQTGHGLSLAGAMEAAICCLAIKEKFAPVSINITELDPEAEGLRIITKPIACAPRTVLSNSSAFGGSNVVLALQATEHGRAG